MLKNDSVMVLRVKLLPGESTLFHTSPMHTDERPYLIISATPLVLKMSDPEGKSFTHEVKRGTFIGSMTRSRTRWPTKARPWGRLWRLN